MRGQTGSQLKVATALSPGHLGVGGSTNPIDFSNFQYGLLNVVAGSIAATLTVNVERSSASNGTFAQMGASVTLTAGSGKTAVRAFPMDSSAVWYRASYNFGGTGSLNGVIQLIGQIPRVTPITQDNNTTSFGTIVY